MEDYFQRIFAWFDEWGDISRDAPAGELIFGKERVKSRYDATPINPGDYADLDVFRPAPRRVLDALVAWRIQHPNPFEEQKWHGWRQET